jgi:hypothetical protein
MNDGQEPKNSGDLKVPRFTFWPHKGTEEWVEKPFSLRGDEDVVDVRAKRRFSESYLYFCSADEKARAPVDKYGPNPMVNWMNVQEVPTVLPPYHAGAAKSRLIDLLEDGHEGVKLSQEEMDRIACWIDLLVPYCGDYRESHAWTPEELAEYERRVRKRAASEAREHQDIQAYVEHLERRASLPTHR